MSKRTTKKDDQGTKPPSPRDLPGTSGKPPKRTIWRQTEDGTVKTGSGGSGGVLAGDSTKTPK